MIKNIQTTEIEQVENKFNTTSLIIGIILTISSITLFILSRNIEVNMLSSAMIFAGVITLVFALFLFFAKLNRAIYVKTKSPIIKRQLYFDAADFNGIMSAIENDDYKSIEKFNRVEEGNVQLYLIHSKDKKFAAMQLLKYEPFDFIPQTDIKIQEF